MKIKHLTPTPYTVKLETLSRGTVFRFEKSSVPCMILPYTGDEIKAIYKQRHGSIEEMIDDIEILNENLYVWNENNEEELDQNEYLHHGEDTELVAYIVLATGKVCLSHMRENVIPLEAELTVEDMRSPD